MNELYSKGAGELAGMIAAGEVTSSDVVEAHLARIEEINPDLNAVTVTLADEARVAAADVDRSRAKGTLLGPLAGVPFTVKENIDVAGSATTWGVAALAEQMASTDAPAVARLREAGAIPLARTNLPDFAFRWETTSGRAGHTANPWDPTRTPGGSCGGEAVALATGMTPLGLGNDLGGSLRVPSQMCGTAALKPSRGRVADAAVTEPAAQPISIQMTMSQGPMARRVADLRLALGILSARDPRDPRWVPAPLQGPAVDGPLKVAVVRDPLGAGIDPHVRAGIDRAADWLSDSGYEVVDAEPPQIAEATAAWVETIWADVSTIWPGMEPVAGDGVRAFLGACVEQGVFKPVDQAAQLAAWVAVHQIGAAWTRFLQEHPVVLSPVCCERPWIVDEDISRVGEIAMAMRMVVPVNILGLPSCAVPVGADDGLPQGVQLIGDRFREDLVLDAAQAIEDRAPVLTPIQPRVAVTV
ncbi:MAG: amidase [Actinomycetota bacterium]|nr:amidase [Actinomycetota bacterium]